MAVVDIILIHRRNRVFIARTELNFKKYTKELWHFMWLSTRCLYVPYSYYPYNLQTIGLNLGAN